MPNQQFPSVRPRKGDFVTQEGNWDWRIAR
jgi:hypothetical protein